MGKRTGGLLCVLLLALLPAGCQFIRIEEGERTPLEYTIVKQEEIPEEISELMEQKKKKIGRARVGKECRSRWSPYH